MVRASFSFTKYALKRVLLVIPTLFGVSLIGFLIMKLTPGDPLVSVLGFAGSNVSPTAMALRAELGLDKPLYMQYLLYLWRVLHANFGNSIAQQIPVTVLFAQALPNTVYLIAVTTLLSVAIGIPIGVLSAMKRNTLLDHSIRISSIMMASLPDYWLGLMLILGLAFYVHIFPVGGNQGPTSVVLPALTLAIGLAGLLVRLTRSTVIEQLNQNYVKTAKAKGLNDSLIIRRHVMKNAVLPIFTVVGLQIGYLLAGDFFVEYVFAWPGIGRLVVSSIFVKDYPVVEAFLFLAATAYVIINLIVDLLHVIIDPRIGFGGES
jgi:peptide/nickel transport system permease protein